jgi:DNA-binding transcriptional regulator YdaS (Cro superfamily)
MLIVVVTALAAIVGLIAVLPSSTRQMGNYATPLGAVAAVAVALLLVGVVSNTFLRHVVQIIPLVAVLLLAVSRRGWAAIGAAPLLGFWLVVMGCIWLFLLGLARFVSGTFTLAEIALTIVIGLAAVVGLAATYRQPMPGQIRSRVAVVLLFALFQTGAMVVSFPPLHRAPLSPATPASAML